MENILKKNRGMDMIDVSVIMPVYNTGIDLENSIKSITQQTLKSWQLIICDDGSDDMYTKNILEKYECFDHRIRILRNDSRRGAAAARNRGLLEAEGRFVICLDSDDSFDRELLETLFKSAVEKNADVVLCNTAHIIKNNVDVYNKSEDIPDNVFKISDLDEDGLHKCGLMPWNKMVKRTLVEENEIRFQELETCNDIYYSCACLIVAQRIYYVDTKPLVIWNGNRENQISKNRNPINLFKAINKVADEFQYKGKYLNKQVCIPLMKNGIHEMRQTLDKERIIDFLDKMKSFLSCKIAEGRLNYNNRQNALLEKCYTTKKYTDYWWVDKNYYEIQIEEYVRELTDIIKGHEKVFLWGLGKRGKAFIRFCINHNICLMGYTDSFVQEDSRLFEGIKKVEPNEVLSIADFVICSNDRVYSDSSNLFLDKNKLLNLQPFCPL